MARLPTVLARQINDMGNNASGKAIKAAPEAAPEEADNIRTWTAMDRAMASR